MMSLWKCKRQLYDIITYLKLSIQDVVIFITKIQSELLEVVNKFVGKKECSQKEAFFLLSKLKPFTVPHFYIIWEMLKNPPIVDPWLQDIIGL